MFTFRLFACEIKLLLEDPLMKHIIFTPKLTKAYLHRDALKRLETKTVSCRLPPKDVLGKNALG